LGWLYATSTQGSPLNSRIKITSQPTLQLIPKQVWNLQRKSGKDPAASSVNIILIK
jgi:hypothetical protein